MNQSPITSYLRHLIVTGIVILAAKWNLPEEGLTEAAQGLALLVIGTGTWAVVKYAPPGLKKFFGLGVIALFAGSTMSGCAGITGTLSTPWGHATTHEGHVAIFPPPILISPTK